MPLSLRAFIVILLLVAAGALAAWLASTPGTVTLQWGGWRIDTAPGMIAGFLIVLFLFGAGLFWFLRSIGAIPARVKRKREARHREEGYLALTRGMVAIAAGDTAEARRFAGRANALLENPAGAVLIAAQAAQLEGDLATARQYYTAMLHRAETQLLGLRGLVAIAEQEGDLDTALASIDEAHRLSPKTGWVLTRRFHLFVQARRWEDAEDALRAAIRAKAVDGKAGQQQEAALLVQLSLMAERAGNTKQALDRARKAVAQQPGFQPAALQHAALLHAQGKNKAAAQIVEEAWKKAPHPDLARLFTKVAAPKDRNAPGPMDALRAIERLAKHHPEHRETRMALARAAMDAKLWGQARHQLERLGGVPAGGKGTNAATPPHLPDAGICRLWAELEEREPGDPAAARAWLARAASAPLAPAWLCRTCSAVAREWSALCGNCGAFDSYHWAAPPRVRPLSLEEAGDGAPVVDAEALAPQDAPAPEDASERKGRALPPPEEATAKD